MLSYNKKFQTGDTDIERGKSQTGLFCLKTTHLWFTTSVYLCFLPAGTGQWQRKQKWELASLQPLGQSNWLDIFYKMSSSMASLRWVSPRETNRAERDWQRGSKRKVKTRYTEPLNEICSGREVHSMDCPQTGYAITGCILWFGILVL